MKTEKTYIHRRVCLCRQCGGTGSVTVYAEKDVRREYPQQKVCPQCQGSGRIWLSGQVVKNIEPAWGRNLIFFIANNQLLILLFII